MFGVSFGFFHETSFRASIFFLNGIDSGNIDYLFFVTLMYSAASRKNPEILDTNSKSVCMQIGLSIMITASDEVKGKSLSINMTSLSMWKGIRAWIHGWCHARWPTKTTWKEFPPSVSSQHASININPTYNKEQIIESVKCVCVRRISRYNRYYCRFKAHEKWFVDIGS